MTLADDLKLRPMAETDRHYVLSSWLRSYAGRSREARDYASMESWYQDYTPIVHDLLARSQVVVASLQENPDVIVGWMAIEGDALHYVLVKPRWRKLGVARWLLTDFAELPVAYTHRTSDALGCPIPAGWSYRRFRIWPQGEKAA